MRLPKALGLKRGKGGLIASKRMNDVLYYCTLNVSEDIDEVACFCIL